jgi:eukaryotic-like serine/threonine-protein kinase
MQDDPPSRSDDGLKSDSGPERTITTSTPTVRTQDPVPLAQDSVLDGRYQIEVILGQGGSGTVFRAWDRVLGEPIAVKILHPERAREKSWIKRLAREVKVARAIRHPNVCRVFDLGQADGHWFVTMELATGGTLKDLLKEGRPRTLADRLQDSRAVCQGLAAIHAVGITHRDVTPQNVLRLSDGRLVLSDFGLAIEGGDETTIHGGTPNYMPPESVMGERSDQRSDVWQLGVVLHEILFGGRPEWDRRADGLVMKWPLPVDASPVEEELARLCADCLAQNPAARPVTAMAVAGRLAVAEVAKPRSATERLWLRAKGWAARYRRVGLALAGLVVLGGFARAVQVAARPPLCRAADARLSAVWDAPSRARIQQAFVHTGKTYAADTFWSVNRVIERYLQGWAVAYTDACEATHVRGEQSAEILDLRMACLGDRLNDVKALASVFESADVNVVDNAVDAANALRTLERCSDARLLRALVPPPDDGAVRQHVERLRRGIGAAKALHDAGNFTAATERLRALVAEARRVGYAAVLAEALDTLGFVLADAGDVQSASAALKEACWQAEVCRHDELRAEATTLLVATSARRERTDEADDWASQADAILKRIGGHDRTRGWLEMHVALVRTTQGRLEEALAHDQSALELKERSGAGRADVARSLGNIAIDLLDLGRLREALGYNERAIAALAQELGPDHPTVGIYVSNKGEILNRLGLTSEARVAFERAIAIDERSMGNDHANLAYPLAGLGDGALRDRKPAAAIAPLERALRIREAHESDVVLIAETSFALARALWDSGQDRARALKLAAHARDIYARQPQAHPSVAAEVDGWIAAHHRG